MNPTFLHNPSYLELDDAYRGLTKLKEIAIKTNNLSGILRCMEKIGFVAIEIISLTDNQDTWTIGASKGKHGPCRFSGRIVAYKGTAMAALDDDLHILPFNQFIDVCDKTFAVHSLPAYKGLIDCAKENPEPVRNKTDNGIQEDFDSLLGKLFDQLKDVRNEASNRKMLFYSGPFKMLVLEDGTLVRRGKWNAIPDQLSDQLVKKEGLIHTGEITVDTPLFLQDQYEREGASVLIDELKLQQQETREYSTDFNGLEKISNSLRNRLLKLINENKKYFVLVGSDFSDKLGCCPSKEVTEANDLVKNGILNAYAEPTQGDSCPLTFYGVKNELRVTETSFDVNINNTFREKMHRKLVKKISVYKKALKIILIAFVAVSLLMAVRQLYQMQFVLLDAVNYEQLQPLIDGQVQLVLFHNEKRCHQCLQIEQLANEVLKEFYENDIKQGRLVFRTVTIDSPENRILVNQLGIFAATLVFVEFKNETLSNAMVLQEAAGLYRDEVVFKQYLHKELSEMLQ